MATQKKIQLVEEYSKKFKEAKSIFFTDFSMMRLACGDPLLFKSIPSGDQLQIVSCRHYRPGSPAPKGVWRAYMPCPGRMESDGLPRPGGAALEHFRD